LGCRRLHRLFAVGDKESITERDKAPGADTSFVSTTCLLVITTGKRKKVVGEKKNQEVLNIYNVPK
jgi:hypothetical protein